MLIRILSIAATLLALSTVSAPVFAADDEIAAPDASMDSTVAPPRPCQPWERNCHRPPMRSFQCYAQNALRRTFVAYGDWRTPRQYVQQRAVQLCRNQSFPLIRNTCRPIGCR